MEIIENNRNRLTEQSDFSLGDIWGMVWGYKWWYVATLVIAIIIACLYIYKTPASFQSTAKVIISEAGQASALRDIATITGGTTKPGMNVNNEVEAFMSPNLMQTVIERLSLQTGYTEHQFMRTRELYRTSPIELTITGNTVPSSFSFRISKDSDSTFTMSGFKVGKRIISKEKVQGTINDTVSTPVGTMILTKTLYGSDWDRDITVSWCNSEYMARMYAGKINASVADGTTIVVLSLQDNSPLRAENILSTLIDEYNKEWIHDKNRSARNTTKFINERLIVIEEELGGIESDLKEYKEENKLTDINSLSQTYMQESSEYAARSFEVNNQLSIAQYIKDYLTDAAHPQSLLPANSGLTDSDIGSQINSYNEMLLQRDKLLANSSESNPVISDLNSSLAAIKATIIRSVDNLISTLQLQADKIRDQEDQILSRIASSSGQQMELLSKERQQKVKESLYIYLLQKREENEIASLVNVGNTRLIVSPTGSSVPVAPNKGMIMMIALVLGIGIPFAIIFLLRMMDTSVKGRKDLSGLSIPFLAEIPQMQSTLKRNLANIGRHCFDNRNCHIVVRKGSRNVINEAFRVLRTNLDMMLGGDGSAKVIMVTSFNPNAGKTFMTMNMAESMSLKGSRSIIVDLDLRKATLGKSLDCNRDGVVSWLAGREHDITKLVHRIDDNLDLLSVGKLPPNPTELLLSDNFASLIEALRKEYRYIFLDCPPVDIVADTSIIAKAADMSIFVMRVGIMDKRALPMVEDLYHENKYNRMAIILNGVTRKAGRYGYGYGYGYGTYGYGYGSYGYGEKESE